jgi:hypothetical protein
LSEHQEREIARLQGLKSADLVPALLSASRSNAALILDHPSFRQRHDLLALLKEHTERESIHLRLGLEYEPKDFSLWLIWYAARLQVIEPAIECVFTEDKRTPQTFLTI